MHGNNLNYFFFLLYVYMSVIVVLDSMACHVVFLLPAGLQIATALATLYFAQDLPQGNFSVVRKKKQTSKRAMGNFWEIVKEGIGNYQAWILALTYGYHASPSTSIQIVFQDKQKMPKKIWYPFYHHDTILSCLT